MGANRIAQRNIVKKIFKEEKKSGSLHKNSTFSFFWSYVKSVFKKGE